MPRLQPTEEQQVAVEKFRKGKPLKIAAFAGSGKTTTLTLLANANHSRGVYLAFNKSVATEATEKFPQTVDCRTTHSMAFRPIKSRYRSPTKLNKTVSAKQVASEMNYEARTFGPIHLDGTHQAYLVLSTVKRYCQSDDQAISLHHIPDYGRLLGAKDEVKAEIRQWVLNQSNRFWARMVDADDGMPLGHDGYLKLWALGRPVIEADYILLDEAQDTNPVVLGVLAHQNAQIVYVGDKHQQIYEWRGAVNAMERISGCEEAALTQSFRFGKNIADAASRVLKTLGEQKNIHGNTSVDSSIVHNGSAHAVLSRTNASVILEVLEVMQSGKKPCICGGTKEVKNLLSDVYKLKEGNPGKCPDFFGFTKWSEVIEFAEDEEGQNIRTFVQMVERHGEDKLWAAVSNVTDTEEEADVILSTAHKAKGREWDSVRLTSDFLSDRLCPNRDGEAEVRLFYVAMTRAKKKLIVDSELLKTFTTNAWKQRSPHAKPNQSSGATHSSRSAQQSAEHSATRATIDIREVSSSDVGRKHPGSAAHEAVAQSASQATVGFREVNPPDIGRKHPSFATQDAGQASSRGPQSHQPFPSSHPSTPSHRVEERIAEAVREQHPAAQRIVPMGVATRTDEKSGSGLWGRISKLFRK